MKGRKGLWLISLILMLSLSTISTNLPLVKAQGTVLAVDPPLVDGIAQNLIPGSTFSIYVTVDDVPPEGYSGMFGYQFWLGYDTSVLTVTGYASYDPFTYYWGAEINDAEGYMWMIYSFPFPEYFGLYTDVPFTVARVDFLVDDYGYSQLDLYNTKVTAVEEPISIPHSATDSSFVNIEIHDIAITGVTANSTWVKPGGSVSIDVTVKNEGTFPETFDVAASYDSTLIEAQTVTGLVPKTSRIVTFTWITTGVAEDTYTISAANASAIPGETDTADNTRTDGTVTVTSQPWHDIAVTSVTASPKSVFIGQNITIQKTIKNLGNMPETFNVTTYYGQNLIEEKTDIALSEGASTTLTFRWNTSSVTPGKYTIKANATVIPEDKNVTNNVFIDGEVTVALHDINLWSLTFYPSTVIIRQNVTITATVENKGIHNATFTVTAYYKNATEWKEIQTKTVTDLPPGQNAYLTFKWNTTGVALGTHLISANASILEGEIETANNSLVAAGSVSIVPEVHDVAVTSVTASPTEVIAGNLVSINATVENQGNMPETFDLSAYRNTTLIETKTGVHLAPGATQTLNFTWNTLGVTLGKYTISANASVVSGETDKADNTLTDGTVTVGTRDIVITTVSVNPTQVVVGQSITISVTVKNDGTFTETNIKVTAYRNSTLIGTPQTVASLPKGGSKTFSFTWSTVGVNPGSYTISANATVVAGEINVENNVKVFGQVAVKLSSTISISVSSSTFTVGQGTTINGSITPNPGAGKTVTLWYRVSGETTWNSTATAQTNENGQYSFEWKPATAGTYEVKTSWTGDETRLGDESDPQTITVQGAEGGIPLYWIIGIAIVIVIAIILVYVWTTRKPKPTQ